MKNPAYKWIALSVTTVGSLMAAIDSTIVVLGLPSMLQDLHSDLVRMVWVIMGYLLVTTVLMLIFGRMADMFGRVKLYNLGFAIFTIGSVLCGLSPTDTVLIAMRVVQGLGGAMLASNAIAIITEAFPEEQRGQAMGFNAITWGGGSVLGPVLGGFILAVASWRWIFLVNLPIGILGTLAAFFLLHDIVPNPKGERFDIPGALLFTIGLVCLLLGITQGIGPGWLSLPILSLFAAAVVALMGFVFWEQRAKYPMLDLRLFGIRRYAFSVLAAMLQSLAVFAVQFLLIFYLQGVRGYSPLIAAFLILPLPVVMAVLGPFGGRLADHVGGVIPATAGLVAQCTALVLLMLLTPSTPYLELAAALALMGLGSGLFWPANTSTTMSAAPPNRLGVAAATLNTIRNVGTIFSFAIALAVTAASMPPALVNAVFLGTVGHLAPSISIAFTHGMSHAFLASVAICATAIFCSIVRGGGAPSGQARPPADQAAEDRGSEPASSERSKAEAGRAGD